MKIKRALISVYDKDGLLELATALTRQGVSLLSTGGSARYLIEQGIACEQVEEVTGFPEILAGRVKTLHPKVFAGILSRRSSVDREQCQQYGITEIDLVVVNLYPFAETLKQRQNDAAKMIEMIDIGGVALLRAAAKNHDHCTVLSSPEDYAPFLKTLESEANDAKFSKKLAAKAFKLTAAYDQLIASYLMETEAPLPDEIKIEGTKIVDLAYGENPHQRAALYDTGSKLKLHALQGKPVSYNNIIDTEGCLGLLSDLEEAACVIVKHSNPCGAGISKQGNLLEAYLGALAGDPSSAFGGIVGFNRPLDIDVAKSICERFYEVVLAPSFSPQALNEFAKKPKLRIFQIDPKESVMAVRCQATPFGLLWQQSDNETPNLKQATVVSKRQPGEYQLAALDLALRACKWVKSNAIVAALPERLAGIGGGQMSRVDAVQLAIAKAADNVKNTAVASDAFFPFRDSLDCLKAAGVEATVQPGGSIRDQEVIDAANEHNMVMLFTGKRHFRH